jgi:hypothetical protein
VNEPITSPEQFAGVALLKIGRAKTMKELDTLKADCQSAWQHQDIPHPEYLILSDAADKREPVARLLDAVRDAKDGDQLTAAAKSAREQRAAEKLTPAQFDEVCRAGVNRRAELKGEPK